MSTIVKNIVLLTMTMTESEFNLGARLKDRVENKIDLKHVN